MPSPEAKPGGQFVGVSSVFICSSRVFRQDYPAAAIEGCGGPFPTTSGYGPVDDAEFEQSVVLMVDTPDRVSRAASFYAAMLNAGTTSSVTTLKFVSILDPNDVLIATPAASRP